MTTEEVKLPVNVSIIKAFSLYYKPGWISFFNGDFSLFSEAERQNCVFNQEANGHDAQQFGPNVAGITEV